MSRLKFDNDKGKSGKYEVEAICNSAVYNKKLEKDQLPDFCYLVL